MAQTVLQLVQTACYEALIPAPQKLYGTFETSTLQLLTLFYATGRELRSARVWPQLKRKHTVDLEPGRSLYPLPEDFYAALPETEWDTTNRRRFGAPLSDAAWTMVQYHGVI